MRLLIISGMPHYKRDGRVVGWGPTAQEIDHLAGLFEEVRHIALLHPGPAPSSALPYSSRRVSLVPVPPAGGKRLLDKLRILRLYPLYLRTILSELSRADLVHVRCPDNISLLAILTLSLLRVPEQRWVKYAGNWRPDGGESWSYTFQRWWLERGLHRGVVTINGQWPGQPDHVTSFLNPCLTEDEVESARVVAKAKQLSNPVRLLYVGRLETAKGVGRALQICARLHERGCQTALELVGDGPERAGFEKLAASLGISHLARFHGWLPRTVLAPFFAQSHIMIFPCNSSEGWPKVLSEAMAYGVVPVAGNVSSIPQFLQSFQTGRALDAEDLEGFCRVILNYARNPVEWKQESGRAVAAAAAFTYTRYLDAVRNLLKLDRNGDGQ